MGARKKKYDHVQRMMHNDLRLTKKGKKGTSRALRWKVVKYDPF